MRWERWLPDPQWQPQKWSEVVDSEYGLISQRAFASESDVGGERKGGVKDDSKFLA